jgi:hypothetical protein
MHDFNYMVFGCYEIILEVSCCYNRHLYSSLSTSNLNLRDKNWNENRKSLIDYIKYANRGIRGIVMYSDGQPAQNLTIKIDSREPYFKTNKFGEYYRILLPGTYKLELLVNCDPIYEIVITIPESEGLVTHNIMLTNDKINFLNHYDMNNLDRFGQFCSSDNNLVNCSIDYTFLILDSLNDYNSYSSQNSIKDSYCIIFMAYLFELIMHILFYSN